MTQVLVLNGPNLGLLGRRETSVYGLGTYQELVARCQQAGRDAGAQVEVRQTDDEATMLGWLHGAGESAAAVVLNPGAWGHYSYALRDAAATVGGVLIEVHLSQTAAREEFRHVSVVSPVATGTITGLGMTGYELAIRAAAQLSMPGPA